MEIEVKTPFCSNTMFTFGNEQNCLIWFNASWSRIPLIWIDIVDIVCYKTSTASRKDSFEGGIGGGEGGREGGYGIPLKFTVYNVPVNV